MLEVENIEPSNVEPIGEDKADGKHSNRTALIVVAGVVASLVLLVVLNWK
jgi:hypothetical protein